MSRGPRAPARVADDPRTTLARNLAGLIWLIVLLIVMAWELSATLGYNAAVGMADPVQLRREGGEIARAEFEKRIGKRPDGPIQDIGGQDRATYTWRGVFRSHTLTAFFERDADQTLLNVETGPP